LANSGADIVLGVALAADPQKYRAAAERLQRMSAERAASANGASGAFSTTVEAALAELPVSPATLPVSGTPRVSLASARQAGKPADAFGQLEAFVMQTFIQSMLPKNAQHVFGKGTAGEVWKSMLAEKLGGEIAKSGQTGIAQRLASAHAEVAANRAMAPVGGAIAVTLSPSASVTNAFLAAQGNNPPRASSPTEPEVAPPPAVSPEQG
jgi:peptidoglycan hydrolase FlgJ